MLVTWGEGLSVMTEDMWGTGDYRAVAEKVTAIGEVLVARAAIEPGMEVLDVACGTGNAAIPAAKHGARVTGLDLSPVLISMARECGATAKVQVDWLEGDAQSLPFDDDSFDRVISAIGHMFAPDHKRTADELRRVCRPDGRIAIASGRRRVPSVRCSAPWRHFTGAAGGLPAAGAVGYRRACPRTAR